jgi:hypothetical protein
LFLSSAALAIAFALPAGAATVEKVPQPIKSIAAAPAAATDKFVVAAKAKKAEKAKAAKVKKAKKAKSAAAKSGVKKAKKAKAAKKAKPKAKEEATAKKVNKGDTFKLKAVKIDA